MIREKERGYTTKWIKDHLGITRDMINNYIKAGLIQRQTKEMRSSYQRKYTEKELEKMWGIKLLIEMGYKTSEIENLISSNENFYNELCQKVNELEIEIKKKSETLRFAKGIKFTGDLSEDKLGTIKFNDFVIKAKERWNILDEYAMVDGFEKILTNKIEDLTEEELEKILEKFKLLEIVKLECNIKLNTYLNLIVELKDFKVDSDLVIIAVKMLYKFLLDEYFPTLESVPMKPAIFIKNMFEYKNCDIAIFNEETYSKEGISFIFKAIDYYEENIMKIKGGK